MRRILRWQRICIICLLSFSFMTPNFLVSYRLKSLTLDGSEEFIEDLSSIKFRADELRLNYIEQEVGDGVKEPDEEVYRVGNYSIVNNKTDEYLKSKHWVFAGEKDASSDRNGSDSVSEEHDKGVQRK